MGAVGSWVEVAEESLITLFDDGDASNNIDVVAFDGNDSNFVNPFDPVGWDVARPGAARPPGNPSRAGLPAGKLGGKASLQADAPIVG